MKTCLGCTRLLPLCDFRKKSAAKDGTTARCKRCLNLQRQGICQDCGCPVSHKSKARCKRCMGLAQRGKNNPRWRGGSYKNSEGYILLTGYYEHPNSDSVGRIFEHVAVMSQHLNRSLIKGENVHHINGIRDDNRIENLELWSTSQPAGQRVQDKVDWALEMLRLYKPEVLNE